MLPSGYDKLKYRHVAFKYWPLIQMEFNYMMATYILGKKFLNHHCLPLHDHFGEFLLGFAHSTKL